MTRLSYRTSPVEHVVLRDGVVVVAVDDEHRVALIRHTAPLHGEMLSVPGGMVEEGESSRAAAERELAEETGLSAADWERVGEFVGAPDGDEERVGASGGRHGQASSPHGWNDQPVSSTTMDGPSNDPES
ncbi:NUDIX domain-containing protein [Cellulomonas sp. P22]|uniref:NUDIX domain-containing protein n=1 Tax=Cellulomonas sp. P22 TaxID=3373189 RepID=UPI0037A0EE3D